MDAFLVNDNLLTDKNLIIFVKCGQTISKLLGTPSENAHFDNGILDTVATGFQKIFHFLYQQLHWSFKSAS